MDLAEADTQLELALATGTLHARLVVLSTLGVNQVTLLRMGTACNC
jgi:hypothetical protein